jgi:hypothetical protein
MKEYEASHTSFRGVELCEVEAKDSSPTQKWRVKNAFEESRRSVLAPLLPPAAVVKPHASAARCASLLRVLLKDVEGSRCPVARTPRVELCLDRPRGLQGERGKSVWGAQTIKILRIRASLEPLKPPPQPIVGGSLIRMAQWTQS